MGIRRKSRELALQALYQEELAGRAVSLDFVEFCAHFQANKKTIPYARQLLNGVHEQKEAIDKMISRHAENWRLERMSVIDRNILRLAVFELLYQGDVPASVAINEAVEISRRYSTDDSGSFINGILDTITRDYDPGSPETAAD
jgi:N utilization substance protein B